jgi:hypothetical protein
MIVLIGNFDMATVPNRIAEFGDITANGVNFESTGSWARVGSENMGPGVISNINVTAMAMVLPVIGSANQGGMVVVNDGVATFTQGINTTQFTTIQIDAGFQFFDPSAGSALGQFYGIYIYEFNSGIPSDYVEAVEYMANNPDFGPYPGWHAIL